MKKVANPLGTATAFNINRKRDKYANKNVANPLGTATAFNKKEFK